MANNKEFIIDEKLLNDIECQHNSKKKLFNKYCKTCQKNICIWGKGHNNHQTDELDSLEPAQEKYEQTEKAIKQMNLIKKKFKDNISKLDIFLEQISKIINDAYDKLEILEKLFDNHFKFNEIIFNSYKEEKKNYYILKNFNSLVFNFDYIEKDLTLKKIENIINYFNNIDKINYDNEINEIKLNNNEEKNMWISEKYVKNWGLKEAIREFIQNQFDGVITKIESKNNLKIVKIGNEYIINERKKKLEFDFMKIGEEKIYGKIRYDKNNKILSISNEGELSLSDFLLGGSKEELNNQDIIGLFGEGMKLAILALCRLEKNVTIFSSENKYSFKLKEDKNFIKNNKI